MNLKEIWSKVAKAFAGTPAVNGMNVYTVQYIQQKVREQTNFDVACMDSRLVNGRINVGLVIPTDTSAEEIAKAEDVFIAAAKDKGLEIKRENIVRYVPGTTSQPSRFDMGGGKTW